ncbi:hypothetical protein O1R50_13850 [Glycomyces luteolus]|uniref:Uncharacterized protein n=1 Tax=Glycomyces luteolus TaxID=2670330 RepID=A0A9X3P8J4_9ACTN|nr:hypothetical protein [Glycomyces luteolus]MDA1360708.1 hypothetical protein [Glycomyces luteolus]
MKPGLKVAGAIGVGYVLGRKHKMRAAFTLGAMAAAGQLGHVRDVLKEQAAEKLASSEGMGNLADPGKRLLEAGRTAAVAAVADRIGTFSDQLEERAEAVRYPRGKAEQETEAEPTEGKESKAHKGEESEGKEDESEKPKAKKDERKQTKGKESKGKESAEKDTEGDKAKKSKKSKDTEAQDDEPEAEKKKKPERASEQDQSEDEPDSDEQDGEKKRSSSREKATTGAPVRRKRT